MRERLLKEFRQLRPAWFVALLVAAIPARMGAPFDQFALVLFACGLAGLAVSSMGQSSRIELFQCSRRGRCLGIESCWRKWRC